MASVSLHTLLQPQVILRVISRVRSGQGRLGKWMGFQPNQFNPEDVSVQGPNTVSGDTRYVAYRIFDATRMAAGLRAPGTGPQTIAANPVGDSKVDCARAHMKIPLQAEEMGNLSPIIGPNSQIDEGGQDYISRMIVHIARRFNQLIEFFTSGMLQDNLFIQQQGDNWIAFIGDPGSGNRFQVNFQVPAGNKGQLNMLGTGNIIGLSWDNVSAPILKNLMDIEAAFTNLTNYYMTDVWVNSKVWYNVITNTEVRNTAGSANTPFADFTRTPENMMDGGDNEAWACQLRGEPNVSWHVTNEVVGTNADVDPSYSTAPSTATLVKMVPDKTAFFLPRPSGDWSTMYLGGEHVVENPGMPMVLRRGYYAWKEWRTQPSALDLIGLLNFIPILYVPKAVAPGAVVFP